MKRTKFITNKELAIELGISVRKLYDLRKTVGLETNGKLLSPYEQERIMNYCFGRSAQEKE